MAGNFYIILLGLSCAHGWQRDKGEGKGVGGRKIIGIKKKEKGRGRAGSSTGVRGLRNEEAEGTVTITANATQYNTLHYGHHF